MPVGVAFGVPDDVAIGVSDAFGEAVNVGIGLFVTTGTSVAPGKLAELF